MKSFQVLTRTSCNGITPFKGIQERLGFWIPCCGFWILCQWKLDSRFQTLLGFQIPWAVFWIPKPGIPHSKTHISQLPQFVFPYIKREMIGSFQTLWWQQWSTDYRQPSCFLVLATEGLKKSLTLHISWTLCFATSRSRFSYHSSNLPIF